MALALALGRGEWDASLSSKAAHYGFDSLNRLWVRAGAKSIGTPISELSGRPGHPGFEKFCRIAESWGYE